MKTWRPSLSTAVPSLLIAGGPAIAADPVASAGEATVSYSATVDGAPESVYLSGSAHISFKVVRDLDFGRDPTVLLTFDLSEVAGVGLSSGKAYVTAGGQRLIRPLVTTDQVDITFPIHPAEPDGAGEARQALASFTFTCDVGTASLLSVTSSSQ